MAASVDEPKLSFDFEAGDVRLKVTVAEKTVVGRVSSHAFAFASPVWKKCLFPPWRTNDSNPVEELDFSEDDSSALLILLQIAHLQFSKLPQSVPYNVLLNIAVLCDKYDCFELVAPFLPKWIEDEKCDAFEIGHENWLFIAWAFKREDIFRDLAKQLVQEVKTNAKGDCIRSDNKPLSDPMPPGIIDSILEVRQATIHALLDIPYGQLDKFAEIEVPVCAYGDPACDAIIYGSLILGLRKLRLWPRQPAEDVHMSLDELSELVRSVNIFFLPEGFHQDDCCVQDFANRVSATLLKISDPVLDSHRRHMQSEPSSDTSPKMTD